MNPTSLEPPQSDQAERAVELAGHWLRATLEVRTKTEASHMQRMARPMNPLQTHGSVRERWKKTPTGSRFHQFPSAARS